MGKISFYEHESSLFDRVHSTVPKHARTRGINWEHLKQQIMKVLLPGKDTAIKSGEIYDRIKHELDYKISSETYQPIRKACKLLLEEDLIPVMSCGNGFYIAETPDEICDYMDSTSKRMRGLERIQRACTECLERFKE